MNSQTIQRIYGIVGGVLLMRAADAVVRCVVAVTLPAGDLSTRALVLVPPFVAFAFYSLFGVLYLRGRVRRWIHLLMVVFLGLGALSSISSATLPFVTDLKVSGMRDTMLASGTTKLLVAVGLIWCVCKLLGAEKAEPNQSLDRTSGLRSDVGRP